MYIHWDSDVVSPIQLWGREQTIDYAFDAVGSRRIVGALYRFPEGVIMDILTPIDEVRIRAFYDQYESNEDQLSPGQRRVAGQNNPYQSMPIQSISIDGTKPDSFSSTTLYHMPWLGDERTLTKEARAYSKKLNGATCFVCDRITIPLNESRISAFAYAAKWLCAKPIEQITMQMHGTQFFSPLELSFDLLNPFTNSKQESFVHPITQLTHTITFIEAEQIEIAQPMFGNAPIYFSQVSYEIDPELPEGESLLFSSTGAMPWHTSDPFDESNEASVAAIGIIGGSDGPTMILVPNRERNNCMQDDRGRNIYECLSVPSNTNDEHIHLALDGIEKDGFQGGTITISCI